jgi:hypothetical protein
MKVEYVADRGLKYGLLPVIHPFRFWCGKVRASAPENQTEFTEKLKYFALRPSWHSKGLTFSESLRIG